MRIAARAHPRFRYTPEHRAARGRRALARGKPECCGLAAGAARPMPHGKPRLDEG
jgi:hypothetical protein